MHINYNPHFLQKNFQCYQPQSCCWLSDPQRLQYLSVILQIIAQFSLKVEIGSVVPKRIKLKM